MANESVANSDPKTRWRWRGRSRRHGELTPTVEAKAHSVTVFTVFPSAGVVSCGLRDAWTLRKRPRVAGDGTRPGAVLP